MKLVIVESPTKARTLKAILGDKYKVKASNGHIRDLPKKGLGVDVEKDFAPEYEIPTKAKKTVSELKKDAIGVEGIVLATDPDREGEAIAWHLAEILKSDKKLKGKLEFERVVFHEITEGAVNEAFEHPGKLNVDLVDAQQARRVLDRLVGYSLSPLLWKKVRYGLSAGRVQSVAVRLVVDRERERTAFKPEEYWSLDALFGAKNGDFAAQFSKKQGKKFEIKDEKTAKSIEKELTDDKFLVSEVSRSERKRNPMPPFKTSTLQQAASNVFGFTAKRTMSAAQKLFEEGLITYHRTDSLSLAPQFITQARSYIESELGSEFIPEKPNFYKTKSKNAQEAHEAVRPTNVSTPIGALAKKGLKEDEVKLYSLILKKALESQMMPAIYDQTSIKVLSEKGYEFSASGSVVKFEGWLAIGKKLGIDDEKEEMNVLPEVLEGENLKLKNLKPEQHFTQPPARYSDATLIKALEEMGIGRPSTYAPTITTIQQRKYVAKEGRYYMPEDVAYVVNDILVEYFPNIVDFQFTAQVEESLDDIADGKIEWQPFIKEFFTPFKKDLGQADKALAKKDVTKLGESEEKCPKCGKILFIKLGKYGKFLSCSGFPECDFAKPLDGEGVDENGDAKSFGKCDKCGEGDFILRQGRFGKFLACNRYPTCKHTKPYLDKIGMACPKCKEAGRENGEVAVKKARGRNFFGCSNYPDCDYASWKNPMGEKKDES